MANKRFIDFPIATTVGDNDIILIWQSGANKQTTKATILSGVPDSLNDLTDVTISGLTNGQILRYDSVSGQWENTDQGNLDLNDLNDVTIVSPTNGQVLVYNSTTSKWENSSGGYVPYVGAVTTVNLGAQTIQAGSFVKQGGTSSQFLKANGSVDSTAYGTGSVTSVALTMPTAFSVAGSPITTAGTLAVTGAGTVAQYIRGDGSLADFPESSGGGSSVSYYLNGSVAQGTIGGIAYNELSKVPILGAGTDFTINADGYIASFITDAGDPNLLEIPGGNWNFETYFSASSGGGSPTFYVELYKVNAGGTATLIASSSSAPELIAFGTNLTPYFSSLAVPTTTLALTDRLAVRYYVTHSGKTITMHTENNHLCQIITTFTTGLTALNGLTAQVQNFAVGTTGTDFNIASAVSTHTFNLPTASATNRGALSSADWSMFNAKENAITAGTTAQYFRGDKTFQTLNTAAVPELTNLYYTDARSRAALSFAAGSGAYNTSTGVITIPTNNNQITNGAGYITSSGTISGASGSLTARDNRTIAPDEDFAGQLKFGFTSWANDNSSPYADYLHLRSYTDSSGGNDNLVMFLKSAIGMRIYQQSFGSSTAYSSFKDIAFTDGTNATGTWGINITGNASTANTWTTARTITIGNTAKSVNGSANVAWSLAEIGAQAALTNPITGTGASGQVAYFNGTTSITSESNLFWDATNDRLGIGNILPLKKLQISAGDEGLLRLERTGASARQWDINIKPDFTIGDNTAALDRFTITTAGNVGINTITPSDFIDGESGMAILQSTNGRAVLSLVGTRTDANEALGRISFTNSNSTNAGSKRVSYISGVRGSSNNSAYLEFAVANNALGSPQMILSQLGNLLVGVANPSSDNGARLQVSGEATFSSTVRSLDQNAFQLFQSGNPTDAKNWFVQNLTSTGQFRIRAANDAITDGQNALVISRSGISITTVSFPNGNVGINQANPSGKLEVVPASAGGNEGIFVNQLGSHQSTIRFKSAHDSNSDYRIGASILIGSAFEIFSVAANTSRLVVTSGGNVGINQLSPNSRLQVSGSLALPHVTKSANYTLDASDYTVGFDCASNRTANLPDATTCAGRIYVIYQYNTGNLGQRYVTLDGNGSQTIDGLTTVSLQYYYDYSSLMIQSNGSNWIIIADATYPAPV